MVTLLPYALASSKVLVLSPLPLISNQLATSFGHYGVEKSFSCRTHLLDKKDAGLFLETAKVITNTDEVSSMGLANLVIVNAQKFGGNSKMSLLNKGGEIKNVKNTFGHFTTIIVDEAHHYPAITWKAIVENFRGKGKQIVFLTATPFNNGLPILGDDQVITFLIKRQDIEGTIIRKSDFFLIPNDVGDTKGDLDLTSIDYTNIGSFITDILKEHDKDVPSVHHKALILVTGRDTAEYVADIIDGATFCTSKNKKQSDGNKKAFENDKFRILVVCGMLTEGYDHSPISVCVILRKLKKPLYCSSNSLVVAGEEVLTRIP
jgi:superfamily II DNA or RNA helicase